MTHFHKSIYSCRKQNKVSPTEAWNTPELLKKVIENRTIYCNELSTHNVARGFERSFIAPRISIFQPSLARYLLQKYATEAKTVLDPMAGYSGRMLGSCSLGLQYTGYDVNQTTVTEANEIIKFLDLNATYQCLSIEENNDSKEYDVLLSCPPYRNKEIWQDGFTYNSADYYIEMCLSKFNCKMFIFVVDETEKYKEFVSEDLIRAGHLSKNKEQIIVINR
jgi:hypothetical protein